MIGLIPSGKSYRMTDSSRFKQYAEEAIRRAVQSKNEDEQLALIELARTWTQAAAVSEASTIIPQTMEGPASAAGSLAVDFGNQSLIMDKSYPKPVFKPRLDGQLWWVEAEWSDGTIESVGTFQSDSEAWDWISNQSEAWLRDRRS